MKRTEEAFLQLLRAVLHEQKPADPELDHAAWRSLLQLSEHHKLLPLILDAACDLPSCRAALGAKPEQGEPSEHAPRWRERALEQAGRQAIQENEFLDLVLTLQRRGLEPLVLKGPVCRALWPRPLLRPSVDDDLLISDAQAAAYHKALLDYGMTADEPDADPNTAWELSYHKPGSPLYVELHKRLFDPDSPVFDGYNGYFAGAPERAVSVTVQDVSLKTLAPTDHLLFLLLHAFKHFLFSGFGMRIVADICLYTWHYGEEIDFKRICAVCRELRCDRFAAALYRIGEKYLDLPIPEPFAVIEIDEQALLEDVLDAGIHGAEIDRLHSANITLGAVSDDRTGRQSAGGLRHSVFPAAKKLAGEYPYLEKRPWLVPVAWVTRVGRYVKNRGQYGGQSPAATLRIGSRRVKLLERYGVIDPGKQR